MRGAERIIRALGNVEDRYIEEAAPVKNSRKHLSWRKLVCLAACLVLMLSLSAAAYAANWFGIRDLLLPFINSPASMEEEGNHIIGLSGYQGSAEWQALAEWQKFVSGYDPDGMIYQETDGRLDSSFARYSCYLVYSQEMADQMDAITEKYGLALHTTSYDLQKYPELIETLGDYPGDNGGYYTYMYEDGTFEVQGTIQFADIGAWDFSLLRSVKGTFHDAMLDIGEVAEYQEMPYETECGVLVTLALGKSRVLVLADLEDSFVTVTIPYGTESGMKQSHLEILADSIDFAALTPVVKPQLKLPDNGVSTQPDEAAAEVDADTRKIYAAVLRNLLYSNILPDGSKAEIPAGQYSSFAVCDADSDGKEELILLYDPGVTAGAMGYMIGYDSSIGEIHIQLTEFPFFVFLVNGNLKALSSHNQTYGDMWPYSFYRYIPESDTYELLGYVHSEDKQILELNGMAELYHREADQSETGTVYNVRMDGWGTEPIDEADYLEWLDVNGGNAEELEIPYLSFTEENIKKMELQEADTETGLLTDDQIAELREAYPLISDSVCTIDYVPIDKIEEFKEFFSALAVCTIEKRLDDYTVHASETLDDNSALNFDIEFEQYQARVEDELLGRSDLPGTIITIAIRKGDKEQYIPLNIGNKVVIPIEEMKGVHSGKYTIAYDMSYYVIGDYLLTAYKKDYGLNGMGLDKAKSIIQEQTK